MVEAMSEKKVLRMCRREDVGDAPAGCPHRKVNRLWPEASWERVGRQPDARGWQVEAAKRTVQMHRS